MIPASGPDRLAFILSDAIRWARDNDIELIYGSFGSKQEGFVCPIGAYGVQTGRECGVEGWDDLYKFGFSSSELTHFFLGYDDGARPKPTESIERQQGAFYQLGRQFFDTYQPRNWRE